MTQFSDKEKAHENKFARDKELEFKATVRRNKLLGLWAAEKMNLPQYERDAYAKTVVESDFTAPGEDDVFEKVKQDFQAKAVSVTDKEIREQMLGLMLTAREQLEKE